MRESFIPHILQSYYNVKGGFGNKICAIQHKYGHQNNNLIEIQGFFKESIVAFIFINIFASC